MFPFDASLFAWLNLEPGTPDAVVCLARLTSEWAAELAAGVLALAAIRPRHRRAVLTLLLAVLLAAVMAALLKHLVFSPRPYRLGMGTLWVHHWSTGNSFPSSHATVTMAMAMAAWLSPWPLALRLSLLLLAPLMAWSRVALGMHFPSDVLAGLLVGAGCGVLAHWLVQRWLWPLPAAAKAQAAEQALLSEPPAPSGPPEPSA